ncbi:MAG: sigma-70 family RNA polymerase sigma factor [Nitrospinales bacterium]
MDQDEEREHEAEQEKRRHVPDGKKSRSLALVDPLGVYLHELRKYEGLDEEDERQLAIHYKETGDPAAAYKLITSNLMLVVKIAMTFKREWQNLMDLIQEGNVGLMQAMKNFDPFRGVRLPVYASWWIKAYILKFILDNWRMVKVGTTNARRKLLYNLQKEKDRLEQEGYSLTPKLLAERFGVEERDVIDVDASLGAADVSLETPVKEDSALTPLHFLSGDRHPEAEAETKELRDLLKKKIEAFSADLKPMEREILTDRILSESPMALRVIGSRHGITREAVRQAEQRLMKKIKAHLIESMPEAADYFNA